MVLLWRQGHVGIYCGKNSKGQHYCIEAKGIDHGTIASLVKPTDKWKYGLTFTGIEYEYDEALACFYKQTNPYQKPSGTIKLGSKVKILDLAENEEAEYFIVGTVEADPFNGKISYESQLADAIIGSKVGDVVTVKTKEPYEVKILSVEN